MYIVLCGRNNIFPMKRVIKNIYKYLFWNLYGLLIYNPKLPSNIKSILFVCKGNICRSPFAEHVAAKYSSKLNPLLCYSAGIQVEDPKTPPIEAIASARNFGINLHDHMSRKINYMLMESYDVITVMETWQYNHLKEIFSKFRNKIFLLPLFETKSQISMGAYYKYNIKDPYGKNITEYDECYRRIGKCIEGLFSIVNRNV